jgi:hypothetical protein
MRPEASHPPESAWESRPKSQEVAAVEDEERDTSLSPPHRRPFKGILVPLGVVGVRGSLS